MAIPRKPLTVALIPAMALCLMALDLPDNPPVPEQRPDGAAAVEAEAAPTPATEETTETAEPTPAEDEAAEEVEDDVGDGALVRHLDGLALGGAVLGDAARVLLHRRVGRHAVKLLVRLAVARDGLAGGLELHPRSQLALKFVFDL